MATGAAPPTKVFRHPWRVAIVVIALLVVVNLGIVLAVSSDTARAGRERLPDDRRVVTPEPGELAGLVDDVSVDLRNDLTGVLVIDGVEIPEDQLDRVETSDQSRSGRAPSKDLTRFSAVTTRWSCATGTRPRSAPPTLPATRGASAPRRDAPCDDVRRAVDLASDRPRTAHPIGGDRRERVVGVREREHLERRADPRRRRRCP